MTFDLIVIGGGPAGCAASIIAARSGATVLQLERGRFPRHKVCGEFVSAESRPGSVDGVIAKPVEIDELRAIIARTALLPATHLH